MGRTDVVISSAQLESVRPRSRRRFVVAVVVVVAALVAVSYLVGRSRQEPFRYWVVDDQTLGVEVISGPKESFSCAIARTLETSDEVHIFAECQRPISYVGPSVGVAHDFIVPLLGPLGQRRVIDGLGNAATPCAQPRCGRAELHGRSDVYFANAD